MPGAAASSSAGRCSSATTSRARDWPPVEAEDWPRGEAPACPADRPRPPAHAAAVAPPSPPAAGAAPARRAGTPPRRGAGSRPPRATPPPGRAPRPRRRARPRAPCAGPGPSGSGIITTASPPTAAPTAPGPSRRASLRRDPVHQLLARPGRAARRRKPFGLVGLARDDRRELPRQRPARGLRRGPDRLGVGRGLLHEQLQQPPPAALGLARGLGLRLREARRGLGGDLVDVGEHRLAEVVERVGREAGLRARVDEPPPRQPRADAVGGQQRVQRASLAVLAGAEPLVGLARAGDLVRRPRAGRRSG